MASVRASCPDCGDVEFHSRDVTVRVSAPDGSGTYQFVCPGCDMIVVKAAETRTIDLLLSSGCSMATKDVPLEFHEAKCTQPLTEADIERYAGMLYDGEACDKAFEKLMQEIRDEPK